MEFYYCPVCGSQQGYFRVRCPQCHRQVETLRNKHYDYYYEEKAMALYGDKSKARQVLFDEEISKNPMFSPAAHQAAKDEEWFVKSSPTIMYTCPFCQAKAPTRINSVFSRKRFQCRICNNRW